MLFWNEAGDGSYVPSPQDMQAAMQAWQGWIGQIAMQGKLVDTRPIAYEGHQVWANREQDGPVVQAGQLVTGYLICQAASLAEVQAWSQTCPILQYPQGVVEIRPCVPFTF